jgi:hypothetical protein
MNAIQLLNNLKARDIKLYVEGETLYAGPKTTLTIGDCYDIANYKFELIKMLTTRQKEQKFMDNASARTLGDTWEQRFCDLAAGYNRSFTRHQYKKSEAANCWVSIDGQHHPYLLPDVTLWSAPGEHHEIKHKNPMPDGYYGLEVYRWKALIWFAKETGQNVMYTIHDHDLAGGPNVNVNKIYHWLTGNVLELDAYKQLSSWRSFIGGRLSDERVPGYKFHNGLFIPLKMYWDAQLDMSSYRFL